MATKAEIIAKLAGQASPTVLALPAPKPPAASRWTIPDEVRKKILTQGIGASVLAPLLMQEER